jgi:mercuric ion transport protein
MNDKKLLTTGIVGTVLAALCCFTPVLVILLTGVGLSAAIGYLDVVLLPALGIFVAITLYALWRRQRSANTSAQ